MEMSRYSLKWNNPYTKPTGPSVLKAMLVPRGDKCPDEIMALYVPGQGYSIFWELVSQQPIKRWSREARARVRKQRLENRMQKKFPLFAAIFIASELENRPDYFAGNYPEDMRKD